MTNTYRTATGKTITDSDLDALATEVLGATYDPAVTLPRAGRPRLGSAPADTVSVRLDPDLRAALDDAARRHGGTASDVIRRALRAYLDAA